MNPALPQEPRVQVVDPSGQSGTVPASQLEEAQKAGYRAVTDPAELKQIQDQEEFGEGAGRAAQAALMGAARGLTFGGSDEALIHGGAVSQETAKNLMEYQPVTSEVGKIGGQLLPALVPGGAEAEAPELAAEAETLATPLENYTSRMLGLNKQAAGVKAAETGVGTAAASPAAKAAVAAPDTVADVGPTFVSTAPKAASGAPTDLSGYGDFLKNAAKVASTPVHAVSSAGEAAQRAVSGTLGEGWLGKLGGAAARGAVEGAAYGGGDAVTEDAVGNKPLTAESLVAAGGMGALLGAPLGAGFEGALGLAQKIVPTVMERASDRLQKVSDNWKSGLPDSAAEIRQFAGDLQKSNDGMVSVKQTFEDGAKREYAEAVLGDQNRSADVANNLIGDIDVKYGARKIQDANAEMVEALREARKAESASDEFFGKYHAADKYDRIQELAGHLPVNPGLSLNLEEALGNLGEAQFGSATLDKFHKVIGKYATNFKEYVATSGVLKDAEQELAGLESAGPQRMAVGLSDAEIKGVIDEASNSWLQKSAGKPASFGLSQAEYDAAMGRKEFVEKYVSELGAKKLEQATAENARIDVQHAGRVKELRRYIDDTKAHLQELPAIKNLAEQFQSLDKLKKELDQIKRPVLETDRDRLMFEKVVQVRGKIRDLLESEQHFGPAAQYQKEINKALSRHYASLGEPSKPGFLAAFTRRTGNASEREVGKRLISGEKLSRFIRGMAKGDLSADSAAGFWAAHVQDTSDAAERIAKLTFGNKPERLRDAEDLIARMKLANSKVRTAAEKFASVREAAKAPRAAPLAQSREVAKWGQKLDGLFSKAKNDADRFNALDEIYQKMGRLAKLSPAEESVRKQIGDLLQDTTLFGDAAKMHVASETVFAQAKMARDALEQRFFRKPLGVGETTPQVKTGSVEAHVNQFARGQARAADAVNTVDDYVKASKNALDYVHQNVYPKLSTPKTTRSTEAFLGKVQEQRAKAASARQYDLEHPKVHALGGIGHGGALAVGLHALGIHAALPAFVLYRVLRNPTQTLHVVGTMAGHAANVIKQIGELSKAVFTKTSGKGAALAGPAASAILDKVNFGSKPPDDETRAEATRRAISDLSKLAQPGEFETRMSSTLATLKARAPQTAELVVNRGQKAIQYLLDHSPAAASPDSGLPGQKPWMPSDRDIYEFGQRVKAVNDPTTLFKDMQVGKLSGNAVDAVKTVYPEIYEATVAGVHAQLTIQKEPLTSVQLQQLSVLFGEPVGAIQKMLPTLQKGATSPLPEQPSLDNGTQPQKKLPGTFAKLGESERVGTNLSSTQNKE